MKMNLIEALNWRYAAKKMNGQSVPINKLETILEAIRLSASSLGLQPYTIFVIEDSELKKQIQPIAWNQSQVTDCAYLLVFAAWKEVTEQNVHDYINNIAAIRNVELSTLVDFQNMILQAIKQIPKEAHFDWAARQAYIAFGFGLIAAAIERIDATPMEGFNPSDLDKLLGLEAKGMGSVALIALGYRDAAKDYLANAKKVRRAANELFIRL
jgi:nitroreductase